MAPGLALCTERMLLASGFRRQGHHCRFASRLEPSLRSKPLTQGAAAAQVPDTAALRL